MEQKNSMQSLILKFGAILGVVSIIIHLINYSFGDVYYQFKSESLKADGKVMNIIIGLLGLLAMIFIIVYAIKAFKNSNGGFLSLGQGVKIGLGIALISAIIGVIYNFIFINVIEPGFFAKGYEFMEQALIEKYPDMPEEQLEMSLNMAKKFASPVGSSLMSLVMSLFLGLIISLIGGAVLKKNEQL